uniref:Uncharacterized protein n=1 Tax=Plectus sambesii TaxID=2011161 RepID=A0A914WFZ8_9BILA
MGSHASSAPLRQLLVRFGMWDCLTGGGALVGGRRQRASTTSDTASVDANSTVRTPLSYLACFSTSLATDAPPSVAECSRVCLGHFVGERVDRLEVAITADATDGRTSGVSVSNGSAPVMGRHRSYH